MRTKGIHMEILKRLLQMGKQGNERIVIVSDDLKNAGVLLSLDEYEALTQARAELDEPLESPVPSIQHRSSEPKITTPSVQTEALNTQIPHPTPQTPLENKNDSQEIPIRITIRNPQNPAISPIPTQQNAKFPVKYEEEERFYLDP